MAAAILPISAAAAISTAAAILPLTAATAAAISTVATIPPRLAKVRAQPWARTLVPCSCLAHAQELTKCVF